MSKDELRDFRDQIDRLDDQIVGLLAERLAVCAEVGRHKAERGLAVMQPDRVADVVARNCERGKAAGLRSSFVDQIYGLVIDEACALEATITDTTRDAKQRVIATLGPAGSNHHLVLQHHLDETSGLASIDLHRSLADALKACVDGRANSLLICAAHPECGPIVGAAQYEHNLVINETFIAESQPLAILKRKGATSAATIALHPATRSYTDLSYWLEIVEVSSTVAAAEGLRDGKWDYALTAERHAEDCDAEVVRSLAAPRDAWLLLGRP
ncbi:MAG: chorismate mutase [Acidimicrobiales bacterium]